MPGEPWTRYRSARTERSFVGRTAGRVDVAESEYGVTHSCSVFDNFFFLRVMWRTGRFKGGVVFLLSCSFSNIAGV